MAFMTLPALAQERNLPIDLTRKLVREAAELKGIGRWIGGTRLFSPDEAARIDAAVRARLAARKPVSAA